MFGWTRDRGAADEGVLQLHANLAPDSPLGAEYTKPKEEAESLPLASNSHRAGWAVR